MFSSLFSSKSREAATVQKSAPSSGVVSRMKGFAAKVSMVLWLTAAGNAAVSAPMAPENPAYSNEIASISAPLSRSASSASDATAVLPPKAPELPEEKIIPIEPLSAPSRLRVAKALKGESVSFFMIKNFGQEEGWEFLVEKESGKRVRTPTRDLIAGKTYALARSEKEADILASLFRNQALGKKASAETSGTNLVSKTKKKSYGMSMSYDHFAAPETTFSSIAQKVGLSESVFSQALALFATIGHHESGTRYEAKGITIKNAKSVHYGTGANGRYQVMPYNIAAWSKKHFQAVLPFTPENQDKIAFAEMAERISSYSKTGLDFPTIVKEVAADWYGRWRAMEGQPTTPEYQEAIASLFRKISPDFSPKFAMADTTKKTVSSHDTVGKAPVSSHEIRKVATSQRTPLSDGKPKILVSTVSANDEKFDMPEKKLVMVTLDGVQVGESGSDGFEMRAADRPETIELVSVVGEVTDIVESMQQEYKTEVMEKLRNDSTIREDVRKSTLAILEKVNDLPAYYRQNIRHYETEAKNGSVHAKRILPDLRKLLRDAETKTAAGNDANMEMKRRA